MTEAKLTPEIWGIVEGVQPPQIDLCNHVGDGRGEVSIIVRLISPDDQKNADVTRLIAAAPELYEALEQCQRHLANMLSDDLSHRIPNLYAQCREAELKARVTLAKARGENVDDG